MENIYMQCNQLCLLQYKTIEWSKSVCMLNFSLVFLKSNSAVKYKQVWQRVRINWEVARALKLELLQCLSPFDWHIHQGREDRKAVGVDIGEEATGDDRGILRGLVVKPENWKQTWWTLYHSDDKRFSNTNFEAHHISVFWNIYLSI